MIEPTDGIGEGPAQLHDLFVSAANRKDIDALMELYESEALGIDLAGEPLDGRAGLRDFLSGFLTVAEDIKSKTRRVYIAGDIALLSSTWTATVKSEDASATVAEGTSAEIARRQPDGSWRFVIDAPTFNP